MTEAEYIALIITSIGGDTLDGLLATNLPLYWAAHASAASDVVRAALVKIDAIDLLLGQTWRKVTFKALDGASVNLSDMFDRLLKLRALAATQAAGGGEIAAGAVAIGDIATTAPIMPDTPRGANPNARSYRGDPLRRRGDNRP
jgi:hypothetical protein